jgi:hypothetical protein
VWIYDNGDVKERSMNRDYGIDFFFLVILKTWEGQGKKQRPSGRLRSIRIKEGTFPSPWADEAPSLALHRGGWRSGGGGRGLSSIPVGSTGSGSDQSSVSEVPSYVNG